MAFLEHFPAADIVITLVTHATDAGDILGSMRETDPLPISMKLKAVSRWNVFYNVSFTKLRKLLRLAMGPRLADLLNLPGLPGSRRCLINYACGPFINQKESRAKGIEYIET